MRQTEAPEMSAQEFFAREVLAWGEKKFQVEVVKLARALGYTHIYHSYFSDRSEAGFPDLVLLRPGRVIFAELKATKGKVSDRQQDWYRALIDAGAEAYIWRPADWLSGEIDSVLR
ncbi:MAG: VRR-NUC domain-containing protein [Solirubrobacteraceae bacterium]